MAWWDFIKAMSGEDDKNKRGKSIRDQIAGFVDSAGDVVGKGARAVGDIAMDISPVGRITDQIDEAQRQTNEALKAGISKMDAQQRQDLIDNNAKVREKLDALGIDIQKDEDLKKLDNEELKGTKLEDQGIDFAAEAARTVARVPETVKRSIDEVDEDLKDKIANINATPEEKEARRKADQENDSTDVTDPIRKFLYGEKPTETYQKRAEGNKEVLKGAGLTDTQAGIAVPFLAAATIAGDIPSPKALFSSIGKEGLEKLAQEGTEQGVKQLLKGKFSADILEEFAGQLAGASKQKGVKSILTQMNARLAAKAGDAATDVAQMAPGPGQAGSVLDDIIPPGGKPIGTPTPINPTQPGAILDEIRPGVTPPVNPVDDIVKAALPEGQRQRSFLKTVTDSPATNPQLKTGVEGVADQGYQVGSNPELLAKAQSRIDSNYDEALKFAKDDTVVNDESIATGQLLMSRMQKEGRIDDAVDMAELLDNQLRESGRAVQAASIWSRLSPEGILRFATREIGNARKEASKGGLLKRSKDEAKIVDEIKASVNKLATPPQGSVEGVLKEIADGADGVGDKIAKGVERAVLPPARKKKVDTLVSEIVKKVKQEMIEPKPGKTPRAAIDIIKETFGRSKELDEAYPYAQQILKEKYGDVPEVAEALDTFFKSKIDMPAAGSTVNRAIQDQLRANEQKVSEIIYKSWNAQKTTVDDIASALTGEGFDEASAKKLAGEITSRLDTRLKDAKLAALERLAKEAPKRQQPTFMDKITKLSNVGALDDADYLDLARGKLNLPNLRTETATKISKLAQDLQDAPEGEGKAAIVSEIMDAIQNDIPVTLKEKFTSYRYQNMLSGPRTQARNVAGNVIQAGVTKPLTMATQSGIDWVQAALTGKERQAYAKDVPQYYKSMIGGFGDALEEFKMGWGGDIQQPDLLKLGAYRAKQLPKKYTVVGRAMEGADRFFQSLIRSGEFAVQKSRGVADDVASKAADDAAKYTIFRKATDAKNLTGQGELLSKIDSVTDVLTAGAQKIPGAKWFIPFIQTPMNITKQMIELSPAGFSTLYGAKGAARDQQMAKAVLGTAITGIGAVYAMQGNTTWAPPKDKGEREAFYSSGKKPYSIKIGDTWVPMITFGPAGYSLGLGAALKDASDRGEVDDNLLDLIPDFIAGQANFFTQQTYLQGVSNFMNVITGGGDQAGGDQTLGSAVGFAAGQTIPLQGLSRYVNSIIDPVLRKKKTGTDSFVSDIPVVGAQYGKDNLEANVNIFTGEESKRNASDYVAPYSMGKDAADPEQADFQKGVGDFYVIKGQVSKQKTKAQDYINNALASGDQAEAYNAAQDYNEWVKSQFADWGEQYGDYASEDIQEMYDRLKISVKGIRTRGKNALDKSKDSTINYKLSLIHI